MKIKRGKMRKRKWVQSVTSDSTYPPEGIFTKDAETIARVMAKKDVSPKGIGSAIRMVQYFINRSGKGLTRNIEPFVLQNQFLLGLHPS